MEHARLPAATRQAIAHEASALFVRVNRAIAARKPERVLSRLGEAPRRLLDAVVDGGVSYAEVSHTPEVVACSLLESRYERFVLTGRVLLKYRTLPSSGVVEETWTIARTAPNATRRCPACGVTTATLKCEYCGETDPMREGFVALSVSGGRFAGYVVGGADAAGAAEPAAAPVADPSATGAALGKRTKLAVSLARGDGTSEVSVVKRFQMATPELLASEVRACFERSRLYGWAASSQLATQWDLILRVVSAFDGLVRAEREADPSLAAPFVSRPLFARISRPIANGTMASGRACESWDLTEVTLPAVCDVRDVELTVAYGTPNDDPHYAAGLIEKWDWWHLKWAPSASDEPDACQQCGGAVPADAKECPYCEAGHTQRQDLVLWELRDVTLERLA